MMRWLLAAHTLVLGYLPLRNLFTDDRHECRGGRRIFLRSMYSSSFLAILPRGCLGRFGTTGDGMV